MIMTFEGLITDNRNKYIKEVEEFCRLQLAYLLDDENFKLSVKYEGLLGYKIRLQKDGGIEWKKIKDQIIPFLYFLKKKYGIKIDRGLESMVFLEKNGGRYRWIQYDTDELETAKLIEISSIVIEFTRKYN